jgi:hypothetical protein
MNILPYDIIKKIISFINEEKSLWLLDVVISKNKKMNIVNILNIKSDILNIISNGIVNKNKYMNKKNKEYLRYKNYLEQNYFLIDFKSLIYGSFYLKNVIEVVETLDFLEAYSYLS